MQKNKKNTDPGILDFVVDVEKGLFSPVIKSLPKAFKDIIPWPTSFMNANEFDALLKRTVPGYPVAKPPVPVDLPGQEWSKKVSASVSEEIAIGAILAASVAAAAVPFSNVADAIDEIWRIPTISAMVQKVTDLRLSEYNVSERPLIQRYLLREKTPLLPEAYRLALAVAKGILPWDVYQKAMAESGLESYWSRIWEAENWEYPALETILTLWRRGHIGEDAVDVGFARNQFEPSWFPALKALRDVIPPLDDLIRMAVREAFPVEAGPAQFEAIKPWAAKMGLSSDWVDKYVLAHWVRMSLGEAYKNLWRKDNWEEEFRHYLVLADVHPDDRQNILDVAFNPLSIREMGYGWDMGVINRGDIVRYRRMGGLSPADAEKAADSLIMYRVSAETEAVRREALWQFAHERIDEYTFVDILRLYKTPEEAIPLWVAQGQFQIERYKTPEVVTEPRIVTSSEAIWAFKNGLRDESWLRSALYELDWTDDRVNLAVQRAKFEMVEVEKPVVPKAPRVLTSAMLHALYTAHLLSKDVLAQRLHTDLGYTIEDAAMLADLWTPPAPEFEVKPYTDAWSRNLYAYRILDIGDLMMNYQVLGYDYDHARDMALATVLSEEVPLIIDRYKKGYIIKAQIAYELEGLGMDADDAESLSLKIQTDIGAERLAKERDLTKEEIIKGVKSGMLTTREGVNLMMDLGYEEWEAYYIFELNKIVVVGDPDNYWEIRRVTEAYKKARGQPSVEIPDEVIMLAKAINDKKKEIESMKARKESEKAISKAGVELADLEARLKTVLTKMKIT